VRIAYLCADLGIPLGGVKGASAHVCGLVGAFRRAGHEVVVVSAGPAEGHALGVPVVPVPLPAVAEGLGEGTDPRLRRALRHVWMNVAVERALGETLAGFRPHLLYERYGPFAVAGGIVARTLDLDHVLEVNAPLAREGARYRRQALPTVARALEDHALATARRIVAVSEPLRDELIESGADPQRIEVVPNGVDPALFRPHGVRIRVAPRDRFVVGFVGGLRPWHGVDLLAEAFRALAADPRFHLLVVGDGPRAPLLRALARDLPGRVTLVGGTPHRRVPAYLRAMDVAAAPYPALERFYFSPLKVLEYMGTGRAIVAPAIGQLRTLIRHGETGLLIPPGDAAALVGAVRRLASDEALRTRLGARAAAVAHREHTWDERAERILAHAAARTPAAQASRP
jgi:glycosyltransferase involved in cell wall biosynthesis